MKRTFTLLFLLWAPLAFSQTDSINNEAPIKEWWELMKSQANYSSLEDSQKRLNRICNDIIVLEYGGEDTLITGKNYLLNLANCIQNVTK